MKVLISLPVHECRRVIEDQLRNLSYFFEDVTVILHISQSYAESLDFSGFPFVKVNPQRLPTKWGNISYLHFPNVNYALKEKIPFEYVVFCSSNELYIRQGVEKYLSQGRAFMDPRGTIRKDGTFAYAPPRNVFYMRTALIEGALTDETLWSFIKRNGLDGVCKSQIEGSAYDRELIEKIWTVLEKEFGMEYMQSIKYCGEELLLPTVALAVMKKENIVPKRQCSYVDWYHDFTPRLWIRAVKYWRGRSDRRLEGYFSTHDAQTQVYAIKGVKRTYFNRLRNYVRHLLPAQYIPKSDSLGYAKADIKYNLRVMRNELRPGRLVLTAPNGALGLASRAIGKPRSYLKHYVRDYGLRLAKRRGWKLG